MRDIEEAAKSVAYMSNDKIMLSARHDPDIFRDIVSGPDLLRQKDLPLAER